MDSYTMCTQVISEMSDRNLWMGFVMFGFGILLGIYYGTEVINGETDTTTP